MIEHTDYTQPDDSTIVVQGEPYVVKSKRKRQSTQKDQARNKRNKPCRTKTVSQYSKAGRPRSNSMDILEKEIGVNDFLASQLDAKMAQLDLLEPPNSENGPQIVGNLDAVDFSDMLEFHPTGIKPFELNPRVPYLQTLYNREREASYRVQVLGALIRGDVLKPKTYRQARNYLDSIK